MHSNSKLVKMISLAGHDHAIIRQCIDGYTRLCEGTSVNERLAAIQEIRKITESVIEEHFTAEDTDVFPSVAEAYPIPRIINCLNDLQEEHKSLLAQAKKLNLQFLADDAGQTTNQELNRQIMDFLVKLGRHAMREDELFEEVNRLVYSIGAE